MMLMLKYVVITTLIRLKVIHKIEPILTTGFLTENEYESLLYSPNTKLFIDIYRRQI